MPSSQPITSSVPKAVVATKPEEVELVGAINYEIEEVRKYVLHTESEPHLASDVFKGRETIKDLIGLLVHLQEGE